MLAAAVGDARGLRGLELGLGLGLGLGMKFRSFSAPTMLRKVPNRKKKGVLRARKQCAIDKITQLVRG